MSDPKFPTVEQQLEEIRAVLAERDRRLMMLMDDLRPGFARFAEHVGQQVAAFARAISATAAELHAAGVLPRPIPTEPRERALELRRRRNTGPVRQLRAPRRIDARGRRP